MSKVAITRAFTYREEEVIKGLEEGFNLLGGLGNYVKPGQKVLLKVNALSAKTPEQNVTTHPQVVGGMIDLLQKIGCEVWVGDSAGGNMQQGSPTGTALKVSGIAEVVEKKGAKLINFDSTGFEIRKGGKVFKKLYIAKPLFEADVVISMAKFKTHGLTLLTGGVKNMFGVVPGRAKANYHKEAQTVEQFCLGLLELYREVKPHLTVIDGIEAMEGNGPSAGNTKKCGILVISSDAISADRVLGEILPCRFEDVLTTYWGHKLGLGEGDIKNIEVLGTKIEDLGITPFKLPNTKLVSALPGFLTGLVVNMLKVVPEIQEDCIGCEFCINSCPVDAMALSEDKKAVIDYEKCINCYCCHELCPKKTIELKHSNKFGKFIAKLLNRRL
ncbi:Uncharacterized conserved protein, DUF362 family [Anaerobranca californiensis DSM 14826]|jgi:uncharacterized protein (DUF362 family)/NAD-dependent dihydropyrimidine dehydrogenase PreA subunit|uniref:Ferredoxin n=1 Tax=Anaerobranca californiensis DSM 14826 TaxID=1120989 RepID=A0A1M6QRP7_9FIRM|nr:DUF362 domain-containing protein [Anaerobranca californiensis]SHK22780.1 Uncharacterized conserved protein, DUF362 family [Anaerobranca californiensis DSM 14826]